MSATIAGDRLEVPMARRTPAPSAPTEYLTRVEAAELLRIGVRTLDRYVAEGQLPATWVGHRRLIERAAIEDYLRARATGPAH